MWGVDLMIVAADYDGLFDAFCDADAAFSRLREKGLARSDQELARDNDYLRLHSSGMRIALIGGEAAIHGAIQSLSRLYHLESDRTKLSLERLWFGMGTWKH